MPFLTENNNKLINSMSGEHTEAKNGVEGQEIGSQKDLWNRCHPNMQIGKEEEDGRNRKASV